jgi:hemolysin III
VATPFLISVGRARAVTPPSSLAPASSRCRCWLLYGASMVYHALPRNRAKQVAQLLDHGAIFLLIAGTYTPFTLGVLRGAWGWTLFGLVWGLGRDRHGPQGDEPDHPSAPVHRVVSADGLAGGDCDQAAD